LINTNKKAKQRNHRLSEQNTFKKTLGERATFFVDLSQILFIDFIEQNLTFLFFDGNDEHISSFFFFLLKTLQLNH